MDTLDSTEWDVVICGTGLSQSLLALALSRSGKKILHLDRNDYYGGNEGALSLTEAEEWAAKHNSTSEDGSSTFSQASIIQSDTDESAEQKIGFPRAYSLALAPQLIYARSNLLPALVSSRTHSQLDFQAVGSWFTVNALSDGPNFQPSLTKVPSGREDVFRDNTLDLRAKRSLMKLLRFVGSYDEEAEHQRWHDVKDKMVTWSLEHQFGLRDAPIAPILALALTPHGEIDTSMEVAVPRIARHMRSTGIFGPGFSAVMPKWGGLAEIAQVACRACAVGGGVYVLNKGIENATKSDDHGMALKLSGGEQITTRWLAGCSEDMPPTLNTTPLADDSSMTVTRSISIVSSPLTSLFPPTSEGGVTPAGAVVTVSVGDASSPPVHILAHSSDSGECPAGQCVLYAFSTGGCSFAMLDHAMQSLLQSTARDHGPALAPKVLWKMQFVQRVRNVPSGGTNSAQGSHGGLGDSVITLPPLSTDVVFEDNVLEHVKRAWVRITGESEEVFMKFEARDGVGEEEEEGVA